MKRILLLSLALIWIPLTTVSAHELRPAYLQLTQISADTFEVLWKVPARGDRRLGLNVHFPATTEVLAEPQGQLIGGSYVEHSRIRDPHALVGETISIDGLAATLTDVLVRIERLDGSTQTERLVPEEPALLVSAEQSIWQVAQTYFMLGVEHILLGVDHLLFVFALVLFVRGWKPLLLTITAFTVAHSVTLALASLGIVHVPGPPVEACIALSIVFVAVEILRSRHGDAGFAERFPWSVAFAFGLLHGLGFAGALSEVGLPEQAIVSALLCFNIGVEVGQLLFITAILLLWSLVRRALVPLPTILQTLPAYTIGTLAMFWLLERVSAF